VYRLIAYLGFESLSHRHIKKLSPLLRAFFLVNQSLALFADLNLLGFFVGKTGIYDLVYTIGEQFKFLSSFKES